MEGLRPDKFAFALATNTPEMCIRDRDYPIYRVRGNCDIGFDDPAEGLAPFGGVLFFDTHGRCV